MGCCCKKKVSSSKITPLIQQNSNTETNIIYSNESNKFINPPKENVQLKMSIDDYDIIKLLGVGSYGKVYLVRLKSNQQLYALKILIKKLIKSQHQEIHTKSERKIMEKINSNFIVPLYYAFQDKEKLYLVTEFMQGGDLFFHLGRETFFDNEKTQFYAAEIAIALNLLHNKNIIYRDLKPGNILLDNEGHLKLADLGLSIMLSSIEKDKAYTICGTPEYLAPEMLERKGYDKTVDWWSLGVLIFQMLSGKYPFDFSLCNFSNLAGFKKKPKIPRNFTKEAGDIIYRFLEVEPSKRLGYGKNEMKDIKKHDFFKGINWEVLEKREVKAPLVPYVKNKEDVFYFDKTFTESNLNNSVTMSEKSCEYSTNEYEGFTYENRLLDVKLVEEDNNV